MNNCFFITFSLAAYIAVASYCDIRHKIISNRLNITFFLAALIVQYCSGGLYGLAVASAGVLAGFSILIIPYRKEWACGGDVKFLITVGAFVGPTQIFFSTLYGLVLMGIISVIYLLIRGKPEQPKKEEEKVKQLPLSVFFGLGTLFYWLYRLLILS